MKGFLFLGAGAFLTGAAVAVIMDRRSGLDEDFGEDPNWPAVPYTAATHPNSPQERIQASAASDPPPAPPEDGPPQPTRANGSGADAPTDSEKGADQEASPPGNPA
jgi:hypothetical protein